MTIIGIDVSKDKLDCAWLSDGVASKVKNKVFPNTPAGHQQLLAWAVKQSQAPLEALHVVMEATGIYHEAVAYALHQAGARVAIVNPAKIHAYSKSLGVRSKTDKKDSVIIARYGDSHQPRQWQPEPEAIRSLKALISRLEALDKDIQREKNRLEKAQIAQSSVEVLDSIQTVLQQLQSERQRIEDLINRHIDQHPTLKQDRQLLESIPGIGPILSRLMITLLRSHAFESAPQCAAFVGLVPCQHESGSSVRGRSRLSKTGNPMFRAKLYMAAVVSIQHNPDIKRHYERLLKKGKARMCALGAAMRKLVHICFGVIKHQQPYRPQAACVQA